MIIDRSCDVKYEELANQIRPAFKSSIWLYSSPTKRKRRAAEHPSRLLGSGAPQLLSANSTASFKKVQS